MDRSLRSVLGYLPKGIGSELLSLNPASADELRLRVGGACTLLAGGKRYILRCAVSRSELSDTVLRMCGGSVYAHRDNICRGFIALPGGVRVGLCGSAVTEREEVSAVADVSSLCIRLPHDIRGVGEPVCRLLREKRGGVLVYSPPGVGKTTLLRSVIIKLGSASPPVDIAVIDTRGELGACLPQMLSVDLFSGYPRGAGIESATRTLSPRLIVCDEIGGSSAECRSIIESSGCGVPLLASAHADSVAELLHRPGIATLTEAGVFSYLVGIKRSAGTDYLYDITPVSGVKKPCR